MMPFHENNSFNFQITIQMLDAADDNNNTDGFIELVRYWLVSVGWKADSLYALECS